MFDWEYYKNQLRGEYTRFLFKTLSTNEQSYLDLINEGVSDILTASIKLTSLYEDELNGLDDEVTYEYFGETFYPHFLEQIMITLMNRNKARARTPLRKFYNAGVKIASDELGVNGGFYNTDKQALRNIENYVGGVVGSINEEFVSGVVKTLYDNRYDGASVINEKLIGLADTPIHSHINVNTRCLFTVKTEYARAVNTGLLQTYVNYGVKECDWVTSGLKNTCDYCLELEANSPYTLEEVLELGCPHVNCCCSFKARVPVNPSLVLNGRVVDLTPK